MKSSGASLYIQATQDLLEEQHFTIGREGPEVIADNGLQLIAGLA